MKRFFILKSPEDKGYTLVEALFTIVILSLVLTAMAPFVHTVYTAWNFGDRKTELQQNARVGMEMMLRFLKEAKRITGIPGSGNGNFIKFRNSLDDQTIILFHNVSGSPYYIGNTGLIKVNDLVMRTIDVSGAANNALLARGINTFTIDFKDDLGLVAVRPDKVYFIGVNMRFYDPQGLIADTMDIFSSITLRPQVRIDKPVWAASGNNLVGIFWDDWIAGFSSPISVSVNNVLLVNGRETVWVADTAGDRIRRIYWTGSNWAYDTITGFSGPSSVSVNPSEAINGRETCWVADTRGNRIRRVYWTGSSWTYNSTGGFSRPKSVSVNSNEIVNGRNTCWVADTNGNRVRKIYWTGTVYSYTNLNMGTNSAPSSVSVNTVDGSCWVVNSGSSGSNGNRVRKLSGPGTSTPVILFTVTGFSAPNSVSVDNISGNCWVSDTGNSRVKRVSSTGTVTLDIAGFNGNQSLWAVSTDNSCWVADTGNNQIVKLDSAGSEEFRISGFQSPISVGASP